jgi:hypothetical protein
MHVCLMHKNITSSFTVGVGLRHRKEKLYILSIGLRPRSSMHTRMVLAVAAQRARRSLQTNVTIGILMCYASCIALPLLGIADNLAISKKIREERSRTEQIFTKGMRHEVVDNTLESVMKCEQLLGKGDLCKVISDQRRTKAEKKKSANLTDARGWGRRRLTTLERHQPSEKLTVCVHRRTGGIPRCCL